MAWSGIFGLVCQTLVLYSMCQNIHIRVLSVRACMRAGVWACVRACVRACVCVSVCVRVCVLWVGAYVHAHIYVCTHSSYNFFIKYHSRRGH